jgi:hypothetical protein
MKTSYKCPFQYLHRARGTGSLGVVSIGPILFSHSPLVVAVLLLLLLPGTAFAADRWTVPKDMFPLAQNVITLNGEYVHTVGNLQMNVTNWGFLGSLPNSQFPMSDSPSAQWPAGSGIEYLYAAGIWVGARLNGLPVVSTGYPETEFYPSRDPKDIIYRSFEGDIGGDRYPGEADDDRDGLMDEDPLNGYDDDGDGKIDEDFAAISKQMFSCTFTDDQEMASIIWPEHTPMHIAVTQETYQWAEVYYNDFVGVHYNIRNEGDHFLEGVTIGIYADMDAGPRTYGSYYMDDMVGYYSGIECAKKGDAEYPVRVQVAYVYDADGDGGKTPGYFGIAVLGHTMDSSGYLAPRPPFASIRSFNVFRGLQPYINGGDPTNDFERYDVLSRFDPNWNVSTPNDYRILLGVGPFSLFPPDGEINLDIAYVCGAGLDEMIKNAANATMIYKGAWFNRDGDPTTGINGRESPIKGPLEDYDPDPCDATPEMLTIPKYVTIWSNIDCVEELITFYTPGCYKIPGARLRDYQTGIDGKETNIPWITGSSPPPPLMRVVPGDNMVSILWDNLSEITPDILTLQYDFEGYQIWRADNWDRPLGTTILTGPGMDLWRLVDTRDVPNGVGADIDFAKPVSQGGWIYEPLKGNPEKDAVMKMFEESVLYAPLDTVPCPPGLTEEECDTLESIARYTLGLDGGRRYYEYVDRTVKNGMHYFYSVVSYDHVIMDGQAGAIGRFNTPSASFVYASPKSTSQSAAEFDGREIYVVPNPVTSENMEPWQLQGSNDDPTGLKLEFRNLPACLSTVRIYTIAGDLVQVLHHNGGDGNGTLPWNLLSRNGQEITSGVYIFSVEPDDGRFARVIGKFVVIR